MGIKRIIMISLIIMVSLLVVACFNGGSSFNNLIGSSSTGGNNNFAVHIDTNGDDVFLSALFDGNNYYISGFQEVNNTNSRYAIIKLDTSLNKVYTKYYYESNNDGANLGLNSIWFNPTDSSKLFVGGWYYSDGIIGQVDKDTGDFTILKRYQGTGSLSIIADNGVLYGVSGDGYIIKASPNNLSIIGCKKIDGMAFGNITINNNYIAVSHIDSQYQQLVIIKKDLTEARFFDISIDQPALMDLNDNLYFINNTGMNELTISKIDISDLSNPHLVLAKKYSLVAHDANPISACFLNDGKIAIGITKLDDYPRNIVFLKINPTDLSISSKVKLSSVIGGSSYIFDKTMFPTLDGGFFASCSISNNNDELTTGYALKMPSDFNYYNLSNNCVFNVSNVDITIEDYNYIINSTPITLSDASLTELNLPTLVEDTNINPFVGCLTPSPNTMNNRINNINNTNINSDPLIQKIRRKKMNKN